MSRIARYLLLFTLVSIMIAAPVAAGVVSNDSVQPGVTTPAIVKISTYVVDFNRFDLLAGTVGVDFYLDMASDTPVTIDDLELMNGEISSISIIKNTSHETEYRIVAILTAEPDLSRFPFDQHRIFIRLEPKYKSEQEMVLVTDPAEDILDPEADLPGWTFTSVTSSISNSSYVTDEIPFSRAVFAYGIERDITSTILKFFLPIMLIIIVSLASLLMKVSSRLGLNASMFLAAVLIHWRVADNIPLVAYATFLDLFMITTYATLVMVLVSGILILKYTEDNDTARIKQVHYWSLRLIPAISITMYFLLFLVFLIRPALS